MKEGWKEYRLDALCEIKDRFRKPITKSKRESGEYPYFGATGLLDYVKEYIFDEKLVLLGEDGAKWGAGEKSAFPVSGKYWVNNHAHVLKPNRDLLLDEWLIYYLNYKDLSDYITGVTVPKLNQEKMSSILVPLPSLNDQQRIVTFLDTEFAKIDALKAKAEQSLQKAKDLFKAALKDEMTPKEGWEEKTLKEIGNSKVGPFGSLLHKSDYVIGGIPLINPMHIVYGCIKADMNFSISKEKCEELQAFVMIEGDIVIARRGEMGRCAVVNAEHSGYLCGTGSIFYRPNTSLVNPAFLQLLISSENTKKEIVKIAGGATMLNLSSKGLNSLKVCIPKIEIQRSLVAKLDSLRSFVIELEQIYTKIAAECDALKQAIIKETFE